MLQVTFEKASEMPLSRCERAATFGKALLVTVGTASALSGSDLGADCLQAKVTHSHLLVMDHLPLAAKLFGVAMALNGFQIFATHQWEKYPQRGGNVAKGFYQMGARAL